jgi:hypothetical protein
MIAKKKKRGMNTDKYTSNKQTANKKTLNKQTPNKQMPNTPNYMSIEQRNKALFKIIIQIQI